MSHKMSGPPSYWQPYPEITVVFEGNGADISSFQVLRQLGNYSNDRMLSLYQSFHCKRTAAELGTCMQWREWARRSSCFQLFRGRECLKATSVTGPGEGQSAVHDPEASPGVLEVWRVRDTLPCVPVLSHWHPTDTTVESAAPCVTLPAQNRIVYSWGYEHASRHSIYSIIRPTFSIHQSPSVNQPRVDAVNQRQQLIIKLN